VPPPAGGGGFGNAIGSLFGNMGTPQGLGQLIGQAKGITEPMLQMGGMPLLAAGSNALLGGGKQFGSIMQGPIGGVKPGV
jgi:hypothetical protein